MSPSRLRVVLIGLACTALLLVQAAGAHLHLCLDGTQAPLSVHAAVDAGHHADADHGTHDGHGAHGGPGTHDGQEDLDLKLADTALTKAGKSAPDLPLLAVLCVLALAVLAPARPLPRRCRVRPIRHRADWRPPLRAPPVFSLS